MRLIDADALGVGRCSKDVLPAAYCAGWNGLLNIVNDATTIDAVPVVRCWECIMHGNCTTEDVFNCSGMDMAEAFCCAGKQKNGDVNGKLSMPPQLREAEEAKLWEV